jgi:Protein of unknown function (DUF3568)
VETGPSPWFDARMVRRQHVVLAASWSLLPLLGSCIVAAAAVGAAAVFGAVSYHENEAAMDFHSPVGPVWQATLEVLQAQGYAVDMAQKAGPTEGHVTAGDANVRVTREPGDFTRLHVRIGTFDTEDNRRRARLILEDVKKKVPGG